MRKAQKEVGQIVAGVGDRQAVGGDRAGGDASEVERPTAILIGLRAEVVALVLRAERDGVLAADEDDVFASALALVASENGIRIREGGEIGEIQVGRPVVERVGGRAGYPEFGGDIGAVSEVREGLVAIAVELNARVADDVRAEVVGPGDIRV